MRHLNEEETTMTTRREFLQLGAGALAGIAFVGCDLLAAAPAVIHAVRIDPVETLRSE